MDYISVLQSAFKLFQLKAAASLFALPIRVPTFSTLLKACQQKHLKELQCTALIVVLVLNATRFFLLQHDFVNNAQTLYRRTIQINREIKRWELFASDSKQWFHILVWMVTKSLHMATNQVWFSLSLKWVTSQSFLEPYRNNFYNSGQWPSVVRVDSHQNDLFGEILWSQAEG